MKIKNLIAVAALLMGSTSAFAYDLPATFNDGGLQYKATITDAAARTADVVIDGVALNEKGEALIASKAIETKSSFTVNLDGDVWTCTVKNISKTWVNAGSANPALADASTIESVTFNCENFKFDNDWFNGFANLTGLTIIDNEETPGMDDAYFASISFPATLVTVDVSKMYGVKNIAADAFKGKTALESIALPAGLETIGDGAFWGCTSLECDYEVPATMTSIGARAFQETGVNADFSKAEALATLGLAAFLGDTKIETADLSKTLLTTIEASTFESCSGLTAVDLTGLSLTSIGTEAFNETAIESITIPATVTTIGNMAFLDCAKLATVTFDGESECTTIGEKAFMNTIISSIELPKGVRTLNSYVFANTKLESFTIAGDYDDPAFILVNAFTGSPIKSFDFVGAIENKDKINLDAFLGCTPLITLYAPQEYIDWYNTTYGKAPRNCKWEAKAAPVKVDGTIPVKKGFAKWFNGKKFIAIDAEKYKAFSVYVDNGAKKKDGTAYFQGLKKINGRYYIRKKDHVILQPVDATATEIEYEDMTTVGLPDNSVLVDEIFTLDKDYTFAEFQTNKHFFDGNYSNNFGFGKYLENQYVYRLTNNNGIAFSLFTGTTMKGGYNDGLEDGTCADAQFFIQSVRMPDASGRLNVVWLDEDGNVIDGDATAIKGVKTAAESGAIYNVAGQKVGASYKGLVIKDGKKYIQK